MRRRAQAAIERRLRPLFDVLAGMKMKRIWLVYLILIFLPTLLFARYYFVKSSSILKDEVADSMLQAVRQVESNIAYRMSKVRETSDSLMKNIEIYERLGRSPQEDTMLAQIEDQTQLSNMIQALENRNEVWKIRLFVEDRKMYASDNLTFYRLSSVQREPWYPEAERALGAPVWLDTQEIRYLNALQRTAVIPQVRVIKHPADFSHIIGLLAVDMPERLLSSVLADVQLAGGSIAVYDGGGTVVSHPDSGLIGSFMERERWESLRGQEEGIAVDGDGGEYFIFKTIAGTDWKVVARIPAANLASGNERYATTTTFVIVVICLILFILVVFFVFGVITETTIRKIRNIGVMIKKEGIDADLEHAETGQGSILGLESNVHRLIGTMRHLMKETYSANAREREAQLRALQAQINPHFLYNTLDTINWMAIRRDADEISDIVTSLAQYFRLSLNKGKDIVTVEDEINLAQSYLDIQTSRFHDLFDYEIDVEPDLLSRTIPKLSLQPIIENALLHGIQQLSDRKGRLRIEGRATEQGYRLTVTDNGVGMSEEKAAALGEPGEDRQDAKSYGLFNVRERIELYFGKASEVVVESRLGEGTKVEIRVVDAPQP
ncbi:sensor histidine kinase [Paenibacillus antri]|uniref:Sensor histidine kinase n=1 Tax=Paenibacillus antri TaxID=2582848 RepID=A0A5R9GBW0_9BACL|nr:sensor histidine kinase [Paenibacillus antri]TLS51806.1 sensor histidine kinase [Paenibacillus antri]